MTIETKTLVISEELKKKVDMVCRFACVKHELINGGVVSLKNTNISYVKLHILKEQEERLKEFRQFKRYKSTKYIKILE